MVSTQATWGLAQRITPSSTEGAPDTFGASARAKVGALTAGTVNSAATAAPRPSSGASCATHDEWRSPERTSAPPRRPASSPRRRSRSSG